MGASGWQYVVPYDRKAGRALTALRSEILAGGDFLWDDVVEGLLGPRPTTLAQLDAYREQEEFWDSGTHTALDVDTVVGSRSLTRPGAVLLLTSGEAKTLFGTAEPTRAEWARDDHWPALEAVPRWSGLCHPLFHDGRKHELAFWGWSGD